MDHCSPVSDVVFRQHLRSASSHQLSVPCLACYQLSMYGRWAFSVAGPTIWNSLSEDLRDPDCCADSYRQSLKTFLAGSQFHVVGPLTAKVRWPIIVLVRGTSSIPDDAIAGPDDLGQTQLAHRGQPGSEELYCGGTSTPIPPS